MKTIDTRKIADPYARLLTGDLKVSFIPAFSHLTGSEI
jgi:hypothetical protein